MILLAVTHLRLKAIFQSVKQFVCSWFLKSFLLSYHSTMDRIKMWKYVVGSSGGSVTKASDCGGQGPEFKSPLGQRLVFQSLNKVHAHICRPMKKITIWHHYSKQNKNKLTMFHFECIYNFVSSYLHLLLYTRKWCSQNCCGIYLDCKIM